MQAVAIPYSVLMAVVLLGEQPTAPMLIGIALVLFGPVVMVERRRGGQSAQSASGAGGTSPAPTATSAAMEVRQVEGYTFAIFAALAYGTSPLLIRAALEDATRTAAIGTFVAYIGASAVLMASLALPNQRQLIGTMNVRYFRLFGGAGISVFLAQLFRFFALSLADVTVVNPLQRMTAVFTLVLTYFVNRSLERLDWRVVAGVLVSFVGSALIVYGAAVR